MTTVIKSKLISIYVYNITDIFDHGKVWIYFYLCFFILVQMLESWLLTYLETVTMRRTLRQVFSPLPQIHDFLRPTCIHVYDYWQKLKIWWHPFFLNEWFNWLLLDGWNHRLIFEYLADYFVLFLCLRILLTSPWCVTIESMWHIRESVKNQINMYYFQMGNFSLPLQLLCERLMSYPFCLSHSKA